MNRGFASERTETEPPHGGWIKAHFATEKLVDRDAELVAGISISTLSSRSTAPVRVDHSKELLRSANDLPTINEELKSRPYVEMNHAAFTDLEPEVARESPWYLATNLHRFAMHDAIVRTPLD